MPLITAYLLRTGAQGLPRLQTARQANRSKKRHMARTRSCNGLPSDRKESPPLVRTLSSLILPQKAIPMTTYLDRDAAEKTAVRILQQRDERHRARLTPILARCIEQSLYWENLGSCAWFYCDTEAVARSVVASARLAGFRDIRMFRTPQETNRPEWTVTVETEPTEIHGPSNIAGKFRAILTEGFKFQNPVTCSWRSGTFHVTFDDRAEAAWLTLLADHGVFSIRRIECRDLANWHFLITLPINCGDSLNQIRHKIPVL